MANKLIMFRKHNNRSLYDFITTVNPRKEEPTFSRVRLFLGSYLKGTYGNFRVKGSYSKGILVGEQNLLSKTFIYCVITWLLLYVTHIKVKG